MRFYDFVALPEAQRANLDPPLVLALRLYTTAAFMSINTPLRKLSPQGNQCAQPHPFPNLVRFSLRRSSSFAQTTCPSATPHGKRSICTVDSKTPSRVKILWSGGSELATMSTTPSIEVALRYAASAAPILLRLRIDNFLQHGASTAFCPAFPDESEVVYPPQTFMLPERLREIHGVTVIDAAVNVG